MPKCKSKTKFLPATFAWILLLGTTALFFVYPCVKWYVLQQHWYAVPVFQGILTMFVLINFSMATFMDPGVIPRASPGEDRDDDFRAPLYRNVEINGITVRMKWCVTCQFYRPPRCSHCSVCNNCIEIFDHHCPWVNNCIGRRNYRYFFMFLISLSLHMTSIFIFSLIHVLHRKDNLTDVAVIISIVIMCVISLLFIPIFGLTGFHIVLVARGRTTNEQVTGKFRGGYNPFSKNCCYNCCFTLCGPQYPSLKHPAKYIGRKPRKYTVPVPIKQETPSDPRGPAADSRGGSLGGPGGGAATRASGRVRGQGVEPIAAQAAAAAQVRTYRDNGVKHSSSSYNRMSATSNDVDPGSDLDEPMGSQSKDAEPTLSHNNSKSNFFSEEDVNHSLNLNHTRNRNDDTVMSRSTVNTSVHSPQVYTPQGSSISSPYQNHHGRMLQQQGYSSPHILHKPGKRSGTPEHMLSETGVEMRPLPPRHTTPSSSNSTHSPTVHNSSASNNSSSVASAAATSTTAAKLRSMGGVATPLAGSGGGPPSAVAAVSSPGRYSGLTTPLYSHAPSTTYNPGYQPQQQQLLHQQQLLQQQQQQLPPSRRYLSESELLEAQQIMGGVGPSTSAGHIQELAGSPNRSFYLWKTDGSPPVATYTSHAPSSSSSSHHPLYQGSSEQQHAHYDQHHPLYQGDPQQHHPLYQGEPQHHHHHPASPSHSYAQQVGYYLQQPVTDFLAPSLQSGGPRTTPSGYPGGPVVPPGHVSPKLGRRMVAAGGGGGQQQQQQHHHQNNSSSPYNNDHVIKPNNNSTSSPPHTSPQGPMTFTRALEVTDGIQMRGGAARGGGGGGGPPNNGGVVPVAGPGNAASGQEGGGDTSRESVYDMNYEISV